MGQPKLLLPFGQGTIIDYVLQVWRTSQVDHIITVVRRDDRDLAKRCRAGGAVVVQPEHDPAEMKLSVTAALEVVENQFHPRDRDAWLLAPADMPRLSPRLIDHLLKAFAAEEPAIVIPVRHGKRGHPVVFPWSLAPAVRQLAPTEGVNALVKRHDLRQIEWQEPEEWEDLDTPEQYRRLLDAPRGRFPEPR